MGPGDQDYATAVATVMAAQELLPAQPSDLTAILADPDEFAALLRPRWDPAPASELVRYLRENLDPGRIDWWHKVIDQVIQERIAVPILAGTPQYPARLARCWDAPPVLFATAPIPPGPAVAIVGSRDTVPELAASARKLAAEVAAAGVVVVSGLAAGIDAAAHRGALEAGGQTVAVMGTGIRHIYPPQNTDLADEIRRRGVLVSQFAPDAPRTRTTFLRRNHVIAGLADVSVVIDGQQRSGSRHEVEQAITYGRRVLMWAPALVGQRWARQLAAAGSAAFVSSGREVLAALN
ncbi:MULTISPECIES: DNA processing protein DprA [Mycobacterium]|uniref:DNA processing protein DprA n=2 Tax=Mycobacterium TaxID=1763 RepID=A0AAW5S2V6_MYCBC|nr:MULTISPECIES: DNA processing protein DprA [Mycobacterium]MCV6989740.1 DNA processing protein DprA [Mycobacterium bouchedurhonense]MCV6996680.1 DNA processing protein DprA [Mycobacterium timonense]KMV21790.1 DNA-binding protein [Mycobacterium heckeshornense]MDA3642272.1 DNA processing protein DprA [Mycobacterium xenopi]MDA3660321.1 DNA processing protein DprA [Mycobacterium xenopi]